MTNEEIIRRIGASKDRDEAAYVYAQALSMIPEDETPSPWRAINAAVLERWTMSGLSYVKKKAWQHLQRIGDEGS